MLRHRANHWLRAQPRLGHSGGTSCVSRRPAYIARPASSQKPHDGRFDRSYASSAIGRAAAWSNRCDAGSTCSRCCLASFPFWATVGCDAAGRAIRVPTCHRRKCGTLLAGYGGLVSIGQQAFIGVGGYSLFVLAKRSSVSIPFVCVLLARYRGGATSRYRRRALFLA